MSPTSRPARDNTIPHLDHATLLVLLASARPPQLVHAGGPPAFRRGHIPGSLAFSDTADVAKGIAGDEPVVVYGNDAHDGRSLTLARALIRHGLAQVALYPGGLVDWERHGGAVEGVEARHEPSLRPVRGSGADGFSQTAAPPQPTTQPSPPPNHRIRRTATTKE